MGQNKERLELFLAHRSALVDYATPIVGCRSRAEDVVQESYVRFVEVDAIEPRSVKTPLPYLYRVVRNLSLDCLRHLSGQESMMPEETWQRIPASTPTPESHALHRAELRSLAHALEELPRRTRMAFELHRLHGKTQQQIADELNISIGTVNHMIDDALTHCAERLGKRGKRS